MIVVSDTGPIRYLVVVGAVEILPKLFKEVICPEGVWAECISPSAPEAVRDFAKQPPNWLMIMKTGPIDPRVTSLDQGEAEAITLALNLNAQLLLIDEKSGRRKASELGLEIAGTLAVLAAAGRRGWLDYTETTNQLTCLTNFRATEATIRAAWDHTPEPS